jgi:hypothetical protein
MTKSVSTTLSEQIFYATVITVAAQRLQPTDKTTFTFAVGEPKQPEAII